MLECESQDRAAGAALHRFRPGLQDVDLPIAAVLAPLDVHRAAVLLFDGERLAREREQIAVIDRETRALRRRYIHGPYALAAAWLGVHHLDGLAAEVAAQDRALAGTQARLVDIEFIRV